MNTPRHGGHVVIDVLAEHGITHIFGQDSPEWLFSALNHDDAVVTITRDERSAGFAADATARLTGIPAVVGGIHGPGFTNLLTALFEARESGVPVIALVSGLETATKGRGMFQELDQIAVASPIVKHAERVEQSARIAEVVRRAIAIATSGRPGPVLVELPNDVMQAVQPPPSKLVSREMSQSSSAQAPTLALSPELEATLRGAGRPVMLLGGGARGVDSDEVVQLAEALGAAVCVTAMGRGAFPETHQLFAGVAGFMTDRADGSGAVANERLRHTDLLLAIGTALDGVTTDGGRLPGPEATVVRVDRVHRNEAASHPAQIDVLADSRDFVAAAARVFSGTGDAETAQLEAELAAQWQQVFTAQQDRMRERVEVITPSRLMGELQQLLGPDDILVCDAAYSSVWALSYLRQGVHFADTVAGRGAGTLGYGLPAAIGAARAFPGRRIVALVGDGGFGFGWGELETVARLGLDVTCVVLNNSVFAYQRLWHELNGSVSRGLEFSEVHHDELATAVGLRGVRVSDPRELGSALELGLQPGGCVVDVVVDSQELPPFRKERHIGK